ncbi:fluoride efflux transporter FluC [Microbacterium sp. TNHR37B]|uniref:fluoride efflux transporter FluC n=1 Tax=Microbacterium sp. TNHR37B TaxID=1775956 RepID=UPI001E29C931|nr:CrcB family protein [Microbacterium sp. TNHR37B]
MTHPRWFDPLALLLVVCGGAAGVAARAALTLAVPEHAPALVVPGVTLAVNLLGSFLLGVVVASLTERHPRWRLFLGTGVMGGFTTYSAFAVQAVSTAGAAPVVGLALVAVSVLGGVIAAAWGLVVGRRFASPAGAAPAPGDAE